VGKLNDSYAKYTKNYSPTEHLAVDEIEITVLLKGRVTFQTVYTKETQKFRINICKLCDSKSSTYNMTVYLGKY
jgi:predicted NUDIX family phosphoesterase